MNAAPCPREEILGLVLAGGRSRRMGGANKALLPFRGATLVEHVHSRLAPQCAEMAISANADSERFAHLQATILADATEDYPGPQAGILAAMHWAASTRRGVQWVLSAPVDCAFLPDDLGDRLWRAAIAANKPAALAASGGHVHFVTGLWNISLAPVIRHMLVDRGIARAQVIADTCGHATAEWPVQPFDPFFNINTPEDLAAAEAMRA
ncbi:MAG: molybdenum cofactor guanylyltransferase MobA [Beijerinckiaceae bacterium]